MAPTTKAATKATKAPAKTAKRAASSTGTAKKAVSRAAAPAASAAKKPVAKKPVAKKPVAKKAPVKGAPVKNATATTAPVKAPVKKVVAKAPVKSAPAKKAAVTKAPVKKASVKKAAVTKAPVKSAPVKKVVATAPVKSAPAKRSASRGTIPALAKRVPSDSDRKPPPKRTGPLDKFLLDQLADLQEERITYTRQAVSLKAEADLLMAEREPGDVQFDEESGEGDTLAVERERDLALSASAQNAVEDIDRAIAKIHDGTYGICEQCYAKIPKERLRALPYAALCVQCKSAGFSRR